MACSIVNKANAQVAGLSKRRAYADSRDAQDIN
jgi:hypothetical protein